MDSERALVTRALQTGEVSALISRGIEPSHFTNTPSGEEVAAVFSWAVEHTRRYNAPPSMQLVRERWPNWRGEGVEDPLEALVDVFVAEVMRRAFSAKVLELARVEQDPTLWSRLDEIMLDAARDLAAIIPTGRVSRLSEMEARIAEYEREKLAGVAEGLKMGIPVFDEVTQGMQKGDLVTIAGFSGRGKSLLSQWVTVNTIEQEANGLMMSLEMSKRQVWERLDTMLTNFSHKLLRQRRLGENDMATWRSIARQFKATHNDLIVVDRLSGCTIDRIYAEINRYRPEIAVVDFVQLMKAQRRQVSQWEALVDITNDLKSIALATDCVVVMVSQDGRSSAKEGSTEENMGGSISIYQAADIYLGLYQDDDLRAANQMEVRMLKNRSGERERKMLMDWRPGTMEFNPRDAATPGTHEARDFLRAVA